MLRNLCRCMSPKPSFMEASAYLTSAAPSGLHERNKIEGGEEGEYTNQKGVEDHLSRCSTKLRHSSVDSTRCSLMSLKLPWG